MSAQQRGAVTIADGTTFYFSYSTIVGFQRDGQIAHFTDKRYSVTTARHIKSMMRDCAYFAEFMPEADFDRALAAFPDRPRATFSKFGRVADDQFTTYGYADARSIIGDRAPKRG